MPEKVLDKDGTIRDVRWFKEGYHTDGDVRVHAYWNFLAGACGYTYGNNAVWQMFKKGGRIAIPCLYDWRDSLERPGARQMIFLRVVKSLSDFKNGPGPIGHLWCKPPRR